MAEHDYLQAYRNYVSRIEVSDSLKRKTLAFIALSLNDDERSARCSNEYSLSRHQFEKAHLRSKSSSRKTATAQRASFEQDSHRTRIRNRHNRPYRRQRPKHSKARSFIAIVSCIAVLAVTIVIGLTDDSFNGVKPEFSIKAYATADTHGAIPAQEDGLILFQQDVYAPYAPMSWLDSESLKAPVAQGYTGALFKVEGDNCKRVQATLSEGLIYEYSVETVLMDEDSERIIDALSWDSSSPNTSHYFSEYDYVSCVEVNNDDEFDDSAEIYQIRLYKILGRTIDVSSSDKTDCCFGIWESPLKAENAGFIDFASLNDETLTITVEFSDGSYQTQVIELHDGWFNTEAASSNDSDYGDVLPQGQPLSSAEGLSFDTASKRENHEIVYALYGKTVSVVNEPHPYSLSYANEYQFSRPSLTSLDLALPFQGSVKNRNSIPSYDHLHLKDESVYLPFGPGSCYYWQRSNAPGPVLVSDFDSYTTRELPEETNPQTSASLIVSHEDIQNINRTISPLHNVEISENGELSDGFSFVVVEFNLTNCSDHDLSVGYGEFGNLCALDQGLRSTQFNAIDTIVAYSISKKESGEYYSGPITLYPNETTHMLAIFIVPDEIAYSDNLLYSTTGLGSQTEVNNVDLSDQNEQFIVLDSTINIR